MATLTGGSNRLALVMAGPTSDYGYTSFGSDVTTPGYVSENPVPTATCATTEPAPTRSPTRFRPRPPAPMPSASKDAAESPLLAGTAQQQTSEYGASTR